VACSNVQVPAHASSGWMANNQLSPCAGHQARMPVLRAHQIQGVCICQESCRAGKRTLCSGTQPEFVNCWGDTC
jgi:hypothetical protein